MSCNKSNEILSSEVFRDAHFQGHEKAFAFDIRERKVHTSRVSIDIPIANNVLDLRIDALD